MKSYAVTFQSKILYQHFHMVLFTTQQALTLDSVQRAKKVVSDSPGLVDIAIGPVNSVLTCPTGKLSEVLRNSNYIRTVLSILLIKLKRFLELVEMNFGLVHAS